MSKAPTAWVRRGDSHKDAADAVTFIRAAIPGNSLSKEITTTSMASSPLCYSLSTRPANVGSCWVGGYAGFNIQNHAAGSAHQCATGMTGHNCAEVILVVQRASRFPSSFERLFNVSVARERRRTLAHFLLSSANGRTRRDCLVGPSTKIMFLVHSRPLRVGSEQSDEIVRPPFSSLLQSHHGVRQDTLTHPAIPSLILAIIASQKQACLVLAVNH